MRYLRIPFTQIDLSDDTFAISPVPESPPPDSLKGSIARTGILHPPILKEKPAGSFLVVAGRKRLRAAREIMGTRSCECLLLPPETSDPDTLAVALEDNIINRPLTPAERAIFFRKALQWLDEKEAGRRFLPAMGLPPHPYHMRRILSLAGLEENLLLALHLGTLDETVALEMARLSFADRLVLFEVIESLALSVGNQRKTAASCLELAKRGRTSIISLLSDPEVDEIINHPGANVPQKAVNFMTWLNKKQFPLLSAAEKEFREFAGGLELGKGIHLSHSPSFEKDGLAMTVSFKDHAELTALWPSLKAALGKR